LRLRSSEIFRIDPRAEKISKGRKNRRPQATTNQHTYMSNSHINFPLLTENPNNYVIPNTVYETVPQSLPSQIMYSQLPNRHNPASNFNQSFSQSNMIKYIFVSRLSLTTTETNVLDFFLSQLGVRCLSCHKINGRANGTPNFISFKVGLMNRDFARVLQHNVWPPGMLVREFVDRQNNFAVLPGIAQFPSTTQSTQWQYMG
jgi:hypothetical protein